MVAKYRRASPPLSQGGDSAQHGDELREAALQGRHQPCSGEITAAGNRGSSSQPGSRCISVHTHTQSATSDLKKGAEGILKPQKSEYTAKVTQNAACVHLCDGEGVYRQIVAGQGAVASHQQKAGLDIGKKFFPVRMGTSCTGCP